MLSEFELNFDSVLCLMTDIQGTHSLTKKVLIIRRGARGGVVVKALRYKPAGRGLDSRWRHWNF